MKVLTAIPVDAIRTKSGGGGRDKGIGRLTKQLLSEVVMEGPDGEKIGWSYAEILEKIREAKGPERSSHKSIVWYKSKLRTANEPGWDVLVPKVRVSELLEQQTALDDAESAAADDTKPVEPAQTDEQKNARRRARAKAAAKEE